jgi:phosphocarrier protein FPr
MVNLLLVSHSKRLADGVAEMVQQMTSSTAVKIATAAGIGEENKELGTNAVEIMEAIEEIYSDDGILVLVDLGSAILSTEMALNLITDEMKSNIKICPAPFVEGAIAAAVQAGLGSDLKSVYQEAMNALKMKSDQLVEDSSDQPEEQPILSITTKDDDETNRVTLIVPNEQGLHARPAVLFVKTSGSYDATVMVKNLTENKGPVPANSLISVMNIAAQKGDQVQISAEGPQKDQVITALIDLFERNFDEDKNASNHH